MPQQRSGIYVELPIRTSMARLWAYTQTPELHEQWDLRFSTIQYLPKENEQAPQTFLYTTRIGFGLAIAGQGESVGSSADPHGVRTSALRFWSDAQLSLIRSGSGYWQYRPEHRADAGQIRFLTWYDYTVRFGRWGVLFDRWVFRPLIGWATAWSFDCLRLWVEQDIPPAITIRKGLMQAVINLVLALIWCYQGLFPKLLYPASGELVVLVNSGLFPGIESQILSAVGVGELLFGLLFLRYGYSRLLHIVNMLALCLLGTGALFSQPAILVAPFNPISLNLAMIGLSAVALLNQPHLARASRCLRKQREP